MRSSAHACVCKLLHKCRVRIRQKASVEPVIRQLVVEGATTDAQQASSKGAVATGTLERAIERTQLGLAHRFVERLERRGGGPVSVLQGRHGLSIKGCLLGELALHRLARDGRPVPEDEGWFETVWRDYVNDRVIRDAPEEEV